jgi:hypothetical protein
MVGAPFSGSLWRSFQLLGLNDDNYHSFNGVALSVLVPSLKILNSIDFSRSRIGGNAITKLSVVGGQ